MTYEEITNPKKYVRVIASTRIGNLEAKEMIGGEFEVRSESYYDKNIGVWNKDKSDWFWFNRSDVQFLTPVEFNGRKIAIGDEVLWNWNSQWRKVYGYRWYGGKWVVETVKNNDFNYGCCLLPSSQIENHRTPQSHSQKDIEKAKQLLIEAGVLVSGQIIR